MGNLNFPSKTRDISPPEKDLLVKKLLVCQPMKERSSRDRIAKELTFKDSILRNPDATDQGDVENIVDRCLDFPDGLQQLARRIASREVDSRGYHSDPIQDLSKFLEILFFLSGPSTINIDLIAKLYELTATVQVAKEELYNFYRQSVPDEFVPPKYKNIDEDKTLLLMIQDLAQLGLQNALSQSRDAHPLLTFVKLLSEQVSGSVGNLLLEWRAETAAKENITLAKDIRPQQTTTVLYYLLITFKPSNPTENTFEIHACFTREENGKTVLVDEDVKAEVTLEEAPSLLEELISVCERYTNKFTIELFLPFTLLNSDKTDVHTWKIDAGFSQMKVSHKYPLVLRSYDRIYGMKNKKLEAKRRVRQAWESNWAILEICGTVTLRWLLKESDSCKDLGGWLQDATCLIMTFVPPTFNNKEQQHIFTQMMSAGTSIALWPRSYSSMNEEAIEQAYHNLLEGRHFSALPKMIWERRKAASKDETLLEDHLTLFWDNPYRLPCDAPDAPPQDKYLLASPQERT